jgi:IS605 OrfB family transposase
MANKSSKKPLIITRKYALIPIESPSPIWTKSVISFLNKDYISKIEYKKQLIEIENKKGKKKDNNKIEKWEKEIANIESKIELVDNGDFTSGIVNDYTYNLIRKCCEEQSIIKNHTMFAMGAAYKDCIIKGIDEKERTEIVTDVFNSWSRVPNSSKGSMLDKMNIDLSIGSYELAYVNALKNKFWECVKDGFAYARQTLPYYKSDCPMDIASKEMSFTHDYESFEELCEHINEKPNLYFNYGGNGKPHIFRFKINTGHGKNNDELMATLMKVYAKEYKVCGSSIQIQKSGNDKKDKIILNLSLEIPKVKRELDKNICVGVDLGIAIPAMCALNTNDYVRQSIGSKDDFLRVRTKISNQRSRLQASLKMSNGGHGRKKKMKPMDRFEDYEANWVQNYNHFVSKQVVDFAIKNKAKYINIENLEGFDANNYLLAKWSYYQLQQYISYKAKINGIEVRKINPYHTSQRCSCCGYEDKGNRPKGKKKQAYFKCLKCGKEMNADFNAARNIAMSTEWSDGKTTKEQKKKQHEEYIKKE